MLSNITIDGLNRRFAQEELDDHFDVVVVSEAIRYAKPEPEAYEITADRLGLRCEECVFIDDRELFVEGANAVGMHGIIYTDFDKLQADLYEMLSNSK